LEQSHTGDTIGEVPCERWPVVLPLLSLVDRLSTLASVDAKAASEIEKSFHVADPVVGAELPGEGSITPCQIPFITFRSPIEQRAIHRCTSRQVEFGKKRSEVSYFIARLCTFISGSRRGPNQSLFDRFNERYPFCVLATTAVFAGLRIRSVTSAEISQRTPTEIATLSSSVAL